MRNRLLDLLVDVCARKPALLGLIVALTAAGSASAGRRRTAVTGTEGGGLPATPEPGAAIAFALGVGVIAWAARRNRNR